MRTGTVDVGEGVTLRLGHWPGPDDARGSVLLLQGRTEYLEKYEETARELIARRFHVFGFDWRGQGLSSRLLRDRLKGHVGRFEDYQRDLEAAMEWVRGAGAPRPIWMLGHSLGAHVALRYLAGQDRDGDVEIAAAVLLAPMLGIGKGRIKVALMTLMARSAVVWGGGHRYAIGQSERGISDRGFEGNPLTTDRERFEEQRAFLKADPDLRLGGVTWGWLDAAMRSIRRLNRPGVGRALRVPILIVAAGGDRVVSNGAASEFAGRLPEARVVTLANSAHEILREQDGIRRQFWHAVDDFLASAGI